MIKYSTVLDEFYGSVAVEGKFELISEFENEKLFSCRVAVEILFASPRDIAVGLDD